MNFGSIDVTKPDLRKVINAFVYLRNKHGGNFYINHDDEASDIINTMLSHFTLKDAEEDVKPAVAPKLDKPHQDVINNLEEEEAFTILDPMHTPMLRHMKNLDNPNKVSAKLLKRLQDQNCRWNRRGISIPS